MTVADAAPLTPEDVVEALYEALLGRPADRAGLAAHAAAVRAGGLVSTLRAFVGSAEFAEGVGWPRRPRLALVGNCVASVLSCCLRTSPHLLLRWVADINHSAQASFRIALSAMLAGDADIIVTQRIGGDFPAVETEAIRRVRPGAVRTMTNIHFAGLHPDICHLGSFGRRLQSPLADYHSRIVLLSYLRGSSAADCAALFTARTYARLGYFDAFARSAAELRRRDEGCDIRFAEQVIEACRYRPTLLTSNHPTSTTVAEFAAVIARHCGVESAFSADGFANELLDHPAWPIYPEIGEALRLPYGTAFAFSAGRQHPALSLDEFVARSYALYDRQGRAAVSAAASRAGLDPEVLS